jgi:hypothetical protein
MVISSSRWRESWRVFVYSAAAALAFIALERLEFALFDFAGPARLLALTSNKADDDRLAAEAKDVAARSRAAAAMLPSGHRLSAFRLGYEVGWASVFAGSYAMSAPNIQARAAEIADAHLAIARAQAGAIGLDAAGVVALTSRTPTDYARLQDRFEADESGLAGRVEARLTPLHRELFLLGVSVGSNAAMVEGSRGQLSSPQVASIHRHATLAGVAPAAWQPLVVDHGRAAPAAVLDQHRLAVAGVMAAIVAGEAEASASAPR